jgi:hypothetical protein
VVLMSEVHASFKELAHIESGQHATILFSGSILRGTPQGRLPGPPEHRTGLSIRRRHGSACVMGRCLTVMRAMHKSRVVSGFRD